ncbi:MAG: hypothetical protein K6A41_08165 [Bacteroidales bacterium]|nr:hypothetical protein [Bacteroidales bacterium]
MNITFIENMQQFCRKLILIALISLLMPSHNQILGANGHDVPPPWHKSESPYEYLYDILLDFDIHINAVTDTITIIPDGELCKRIAKGFRIKAYTIEGKKTVGELLTDILRHKYPKRHTDYNDFMKIQFSSNQQDFYEHFEHYTNSIYFDELVEKYYALSLYKLWIVTQKHDDTTSYIHFLNVYDFYSSFYCEDILEIEAEDCVFHHSQYEGYDKIPACLFANEAKRRLYELQQSN